MKIHWKRVLIAGIAMEIGFIFYVFVILRSSGVQNSIEGLVGAFVLMFIGGLWTAKKSILSATSNNLLLESTLNGALVGMIAMVLYMLIRIGGSAATGEGLVFPGFTLNHFFKVIGGAAGGIATASITVSKRKDRASDT